MNHYPGKLLPLLRELAQAALIAAVVFAASHSAMQAREVQGPSMQPNYKTGERVFVNRLRYLHVDRTTLARVMPSPSANGGPIYVFGAPRRGDVVVFNPPVPSTEPYIKRIVGGPGDHVQIAGGRVSVNGQQLPEPYLHVVQTACAGAWCDVQLSGDQYYVLGDNRPQSSDSRYWGPVTAGRILGAAWFVYFPFDDFGPAR